MEQLPDAWRAGFIPEVRGTRPSDGCYEPTICSSVNAGFDTAGVTDGACGVPGHRAPTMPRWMLGQRDCMLVTHVGKEAFIAALSDGKLQLEVMKREPQNVEAALSHAIKLEAFEQSLACQGTWFDQDDGHVKCRRQTVCVAADPGTGGFGGRALVKPLCWMLQPLSALPRVPLCRQQRRRVWPSLEEPSVRRLDAGVVTSDTPVSWIRARSASSWDTGPMSVTDAESAEVNSVSCPLVSPTHIYHHHHHHHRERAPTGA